MNHFFNVKNLDEVLELTRLFPATKTESLPLTGVSSRILAEDILADEDIPGFRRSTMDGYAVHSSSTFGASESSPAWLTLAGSISMGDVPSFQLFPGQAAKISTGGMLPEGSDSVVMVEHTEAVDDASVEIYKSVAPLQNVIDRAEDFARGQILLKKGSVLRPQEIGLAAALGHSELLVYKQPVIGIISTGDEIVGVQETPGPGKIRDINSFSLAALAAGHGSMPRLYGIVKDNKTDLLKVLKTAVAETDMVLISGGSSVGLRDFTVEVLSLLEAAELLVHGISISPGKPTILAKSGSKPVWGLPGHVVSAMIVFQIVVLPFLNRIKGSTASRETHLRIPATLSRNISSAQGRRDFIRVKLQKQDNRLMALPVLGKSGLIRTMVLADGLLEIGENIEGIEKDTLVTILLL